MDFEKLAELLPKPTSTWTVADTQIWIEFVGLHCLAENFQKLGIDGSCLSKLTQEDFKEELGISSRIMMKKIMAWIGTGFHNYDEFLKRNKLSITYKPGMMLRTIQSKDKNSQQKIQQNPKLSEHEIKRESTHTDARRTEENQLIIKQCEVLQANYYSLKNKGGMMGRHSSNQIPIPDEFISRFHAEILFQEGEYWIRDYGSNSGTFIRITEKKKIYNKIILQMGSNQFQVQISDKQMITLNIIEGPNAQDCLMLPKKDKITIGRKPQNEINFPEDHHLSNIHATLFQVNGIWYVEDLGSTNGTWIRLSEEGMKSHKWKLDDKTQFKLSTNLTYECRRNTGNRKTEKEKQKIEKCIYCKEADRNAILLPCKHNTCCYDCITTLRIEKCDICGADISDVIKIFKV